MVSHLPKGRTTHPYWKEEGRKGEDLGGGGTTLPPNRPDLPSASTAALTKSNDVFVSCTVFPWLLTRTLCCRISILAHIVAHGGWGGGGGAPEKDKD